MQSPGKTAASTPPRAAAPSSFWRAQATLPGLVLGLGLGLFGVGCNNTNKPIIIKGPIVQPVAEARWTTMRAVHRVHIDFAKGDGRQQLDLRGILAVERPERFRLRALGPAEVMLFDIVKLGGDIKVLQGMPGASAAMEQKVLLSIGADLAATYDLEPRLPSRVKSIGFKEGELRITETERTVRAQQFKEIQGQSVPTRIEIHNTALDYRVSIDVESAVLDEKLEPALFRLKGG